MTTENEQLPAAPGFPVERSVSGPVPKREDRGAWCFDRGCNGCDECTDYDDCDNEPEGCEECGWGKVLGCWKCGGL